jgi:geranylgeranyl diphosphate synthase type I
MLNQIKIKLERGLRQYTTRFNSLYSLRKISPLLFSSIREFILRPGKRLRPILFIIGYLGFAKKEAPGLYTSALSLELLHDYMLVHDDIIDKSSLRRGKPSMHSQLNSYLKKFKGAKFSGEDLAIVTGDVMYALALHSFLSVEVPSQRKEKALKKLIEAALLTGSGEFVELLCGTKDIAKITKNDIYKIYDLKTAFYTFAAPLAMGAILAGASDLEVEKLVCFGISSGRAFQIKDDIMGMFSNEKEIGKSMLTDLKEAKKTLLVWFAYMHAGAKDKFALRNMLNKNNANKSDLHAMRKLITDSGALAHAQKEINRLLAGSRKLIDASKMRPEIKKLLTGYTQEILAT